MLCEDSPTIANNTVEADLFPELIPLNGGVRRGNLTPQEGYGALSTLCRAYSRT